MLDQHKDVEVCIQEHDFNVADEYLALLGRSPNAGAIVFFVGIVRDLYDKQDQDRVDYIELSHYSGMTESLCKQIIAEAKQRFSIDGVKIVHRVGKLYASDQIVFVAIASRHRSDAFEASQFIMDYLKTRATIWKKEVGSRGEQWLGLKDKDSQAVKRWSE